MKSVFFNEIDNLLKSFNPNKIVFWVGAGIDADAPTCLPIGNQLTEYVLELSCGICDKDNCGADIRTKIRALRRCCIVLRK